jgi:hypothetical protein
LEQRLAVFMLGEGDRAAVGKDDLPGKAEADPGPINLGGEKRGEDVVLKRLFGNGSAMRLDDRGPV